MGKTEGKRPLERPNRRWEYRIKMDLKEIILEAAEWVNLAQGGDKWWAVVEK